MNIRRYQAFLRLENIFMFHDNVEKLAKKLETRILKTRSDLAADCLQDVIG